MVRRPMRRIRWLVWGGMWLSPLFHEGAFTSALKPVCEICGFILVLTARGKDCLGALARYIVLGIRELDGV